MLNESIDMNKRIQELLAELEEVVKDENPSHNATHGSHGRSPRVSTYKDKVMIDARGFRLKTEELNNDG